MPKLTDYKDEPETHVETPLPPIRHDAEALTYRFDDEHQGAQRA